MKVKDDEPGLPVIWIQLCCVEGPIPPQVLFRATEVSLLPVPLCAYVMLVGCAGGKMVPDWKLHTELPDCATTNLIDWNTLWITNSPPMPFGWVDTNGSDFPARFYRLQAGPPF